MRILSIKHLVTAAMLFIAPAAMSQAYGKVIITNYLTERVNVVVSYAACRPDAFLVSQGRVSGDSIIPGVNRAQPYRGACLVKKITGTYEKYPKSPITEFQSGGTAVSHFYIKNQAFSEWPGIWSKSSFWDDSIKQRRELEKTNPEKLIPIKKKP
ncbi:MAG: hypothetical protein H7247_12390 [Polaromonas sp.]|nr:hypothetical protein [Gemmatimonadaceae bacterium]